MTTIKTILTTIAALGLGAAGLTGCDMATKQGMPYSYHGPIDATAAGTGQTPSNQTTNSSTPNAAPTATNSNANTPDPVTPPPTPGPASPPAAAGFRPTGSTATRGNNQHVIVNGQMTSSYGQTPYFTLTQETDGTPIGLGGGTPFTVTCNDQEAIVGYELSVTAFQADEVILNQLSSIGCKDVNKLDQANTRWVIVNAGARGQQAKRYFAPRGYAMMEWSGELPIVNGNNAIRNLRPFALPLDATSPADPIVPGQTDPSSDGGWFTWNSDATYFGWGETASGPSPTVHAPCPTGTVLTGVKGTVNSTVSQMTGICRAVTLSNSATYAPNTLTMAAPTTLAQIGDGTGTQDIRDCDAGQAIVGLEMRNNDVIRSIKIGCRDINHLTDVTVPITWKQQAGDTSGRYINDAETVITPRGYAIISFGAKHTTAGAASADSIIAFDPIMRPVDATGVDATYDFTLDAGNVFGDITQSVSWDGNECPAGAVLTGLVTHATADAITSVQGKCSVVRAN